MLSLKRKLRSSCALLVRFSNLFRHVGNLTTLTANYSGVPPKEVVDRLHAANIPVMNMIGHPKHIAKALDAGVDIFCAQGGEGGGHTGDVVFSVRHFGDHPFNHLVLPRLRTL